METENSWVKPSFIAKLVEVDPHTVRNWCHREESPLPHKQLGHVLRINVGDFWAWWHTGYEINHFRKKVQRLYTLPERR
jgi:hypothetical protein